MTIFRFLCLCLVLTMFNTAAADSLRCGNRLVQPGDTKARVLLLCGQPEYRDVVEEKNYYVKLHVSLVQTSVLIEQWTYNPGPGHFLRLLEFQGNRLTEISLGPRS